MEQRKSSCKRKTGETDIKVEFAVDGAGVSEVKTGIPFLDHMLSLFARHGRFDLRIEASGDLDVDSHHTVEDVGITLGSAASKALGSREGIRRFGSAYAPMDEALARVALDLSGRPFLRYEAEFPDAKREEFNTGLVEEFMRGFSVELRMTVHVKLLYGKDGHHIAEAIFKALGLALDEASRPDPRMPGVPSTKGKLQV